MLFVSAQVYVSLQFAQDPTTATLLQAEQVHYVCGYSPVVWLHPLTVPRDVASSATYRCRVSQDTLVCITVCHDLVHLHTSHRNTRICAIVKEGTTINSNSDDVRIYYCHTYVVVIFNLVTLATYVVCHSNLHKCSRADNHKRYW